MHGPVGKTLIKMTLPMVAGLLSAVTHNLADTFFVGRIDPTDDAPLAAMALTFPVAMFVGALTMGLGMGVSTAVARAIGEGNLRRARRLTTDGLGLGVIVVAVLTAVGLSVMDPVFRLLNATEELMPMIREYMTVWFAGMVVIMAVPMLANAAVRASGDTVTPSIIMILGAGLNIALDPLMIYGWWGFPRMGIAGAALATVISGVFATVAALYVVGVRKGMLDLKRMYWLRLYDSARRVLHIGAPAAGSMLMYPLTMAVITRMAIHFGGEAGAGANGAGGRVEGMAMMALWALSGTMMAFVGQNHGAGNLARVSRAITLSYTFSLIWGALCIVVFMLIGESLAPVFNKEPTLVEYLRAYFWVMPLGYGLRGVAIVTSSTLNALHRPLLAGGHNMVRMFGLYIPLGYLGGRMAGIMGLFAGIALANVIAGVLGWVLVTRVLARQRQAELPAPASADHEDAEPPPVGSEEAPTA